MATKAQLEMELAKANETLRTYERRKPWRILLVVVAALLAITLLALIIISGPWIFYAIMFVLASGGP